MVIRPLCHLSRMLCLKLFVLNACFIWFSWFKNYVGLPNIDKYLYIHNFIKLHVYNKPIFILCDFFLKQEVNLKSHGFSEKLALVAYSPLYFSYKVSFHEDNSKFKKKKLIFSWFKSKYFQKSCYQESWNWPVTLLLQITLLIFIKD